MQGFRFYCNLFAGWGATNRTILVIASGYVAGLLTTGNLLFCIPDGPGCKGYQTCTQ